MQAPLLTCDYLLSPARCEPHQVGEVVMNLVDYVKSNDVLGLNHRLEINITQKLMDAKLYPCEQLFKQNFGHGGEEHIFDARDVAKLVNRILTRGEEFEYENERIWDLENKLINPEFLGANRERCEQLNHVVETVAMFNEFEKSEIAVLHFCQLNAFESVTISGTLVEAEPVPNCALPTDVSKTVAIYQDYRRYLAEVTEAALLTDSVECAHMFHEALYCVMLSEHYKKTGSVSQIRRDSFGIGRNFISSLRVNQCLPGDRYGSVCLASILAVLCADNTYEIKVFGINEQSKEPRTHGEFSAYRSHITKGAVGLRLMFWKRNDGFIELANVGPKQELKIESPSR
jgi:hypothetical protein